MRLLFLKTLLTGLALTALAPLAFAEFVVPAAPNGYVLDEANVLSDATEAQLQSELTTLSTETSTQIVVVTLLDLQGYEPEQAALKIGRAWGVGQTGTDNGVVFLIAPNDRVARIEVGYGLEGAITDAQSYDILNSVALPRFAEGNYDQGALDAVSALETLARGEPFTVPDSTSSDADNPLWVILFYLLPLGWGFLSWMSNSKAWWVGGVFGGIFGFLFAGGLLGLGLGLAGGLLLDYILSTFFYQKLGVKNGHNSWWYLGGGGSGGSSGGFGGFGGGGFGGGGASGRW
jgi:uncharacterized protein